MKTEALLVRTGGLKHSLHENHVKRIGKSLQ